MSPIDAGSLYRSNSTVFSPDLKKQLTAVLRKLNQSHRLNTDEAHEAARRKLLEFAQTAGIINITLENMQVDEILGKPSCCLAVYGSLRPGQQNFSVVESIPGEWIAGTTEGELGSWRQYKRLVVDSGAQNEIPVDVLRSEQLPKHWQRLDHFEGPAYERILWPVKSKSGLVVVSLYARPGA